MPQQKLLKVLKSLQSEAQQRYKATIKGVFGSYARDTASTDSDIDLLVEFEEGADLLDLTGLGDYLESQTHCKVDLVTLSALRQEIREQVMSELVPV